LVVQRKLIVDSITGINLLPVHDGRTKRLELDLFYYLAADRFDNLFWL
jgi:hypothetical protein